MLSLMGRMRAAAGIPRGTTEGRPHVAGVPDELPIEIDADGSPVSLPAAEWFVCFVPGLQKQWWHCFTNKRHQHVFLMRMVDDASWILVEPWWTRMVVSVLTLDEAVKYLRWGATGNMLQIREDIPGSGNQAHGWSNCAVLTSFLLGRSFWTWTPHGLYHRLRAERGARPVDLAQWLANHVREVATRHTDRALKVAEADEGKSLRAILLDLGSTIMTALTSGSGLALYKVAVSEASRFPAAADTYWECAPQRAIETVRKVLQKAQLRGEVDIHDPAVAARQFVAMLRGDVHLQILFGLRSGPDAPEIQNRVTSAVDVLLNGALVSSDVSRASSPCHMLDPSAPPPESNPDVSGTEAGLPSVRGRRTTPPPHRARSHFITTDGRAD
jgi:AefR-like transcriptional repressor, C-terminal domain